MHKGFTPSEKAPRIRRASRRGSLTGFTLIETLVAVTILAMAIAGPLSIASKGLQTALVAKDETTAYYLAQDAVEYARFARDTNRLSTPTADWLTGSGGNSTDLSPCVSADGSATCYFDTLDLNPTKPTACPGGACPELYYDPTNHYFTYSTASPAMRTVFLRTISIKTPVGSNTAEASMTVTVTWSDLPGVTHKVSVTEDLYNWR